MNILFVHEKCGYFGGVEQNVADTARGLAARGHRCSLAWGELTSRNPGAFAGLFDAEARCGDLGPRGGGEPLAAVVDRLRPDVLYVHKVGRLPPGLDARVERRTVRMVHDHDLCCPRRHKYYALTGRVCSAPLGWRCVADAAFVARSQSGFPVKLVDLRARWRELRRNRRLGRLLVASRFMRDELLQNGFAPAAVHVVPLAQPFTERAPAPLPEERSLLFVGQLVRGKGADLMLRALAELGPTYRATLVGDGNARRSLQALAGRLRLGDRVRFAGWVGHEQLAELYAAARTVVVPSRWPEPFGLVGLEAMQHGRPVVAFAVGGIPDWLEPGITGLLVTPGDSRELGLAIRRVMEEPGLAARLGAAGFARVRSHHVFERYLDALEWHLGRAAGLDNDNQGSRL